MECKSQEQIVQIKTNIKTMRNWLSDDAITQCFDFALSDFLAIKYPSDNNRPSRDKVVLDFNNSQWIQKRMIDILDRAGGLSVSAYRENGLNLTYGASYIDPELKKELMPKAGVPR